MEVPGNGQKLKDSEVVVMRGVEASSLETAWFEKMMKPKTRNGSIIVKSLLKNSLKDLWKTVERVLKAKKRVKVVV